MAVKLRFQRIGTKNAPIFRLVAAEASKRRDGAFVELLGTYDPRSDAYTLHLERIEYRLKTGAQPSDRAKSLIRQARKQPLVNGRVSFNPRLLVQA